MPRISAGLMMYRFCRGEHLQILLAHPGGPFFRNKDDGAWSIPKGKVEPNEDLLTAARREFEEETGFPAAGPFVALSPITQKSGKIVHAWAFAGDCDLSTFKSNAFSMEWPPKSGREVSFPEIDRVDFFDLETARVKINPAQIGLINDLEQQLRQRDTI